MSLGNEEKKQNSSPVGELYSSKKEIFLLSFPKKIVSLQSEANNIHKRIWRRFIL